MAAKIGTVKAELVLRVAGEEAVVGTLEMPVTVGGPDETGRATVTFAKDTVRHELKKLGKRIAKDLA